MQSLVRMRVERKVCGGNDRTSISYTNTDHDLLLFSSSSQGGPVQRV